MDEAEEDRKADSPPSYMDEAVEARKADSPPSYMDEAVEARKADSSPSYMDEAVEGRKADSPPSYKEQHRELHQSTRAIVAGYSADLSERSVKPPVFRTSTFQFANAEEGERFFQRAYHLPEDDGGEVGLIYSRINNPNVEIWEDKMVAIEEGAGYAAAFPSGMSAITTTILALVPSGGRILYSHPCYGGTYYFLEEMAGRFAMTSTSIDMSDLDLVERTMATSEPFDLLFVETPANPTMAMTDLEGVTALARRYSGGHAAVAVDNTFLGPVFQRPLELGADLVIYSATKFLGGHSDLLAGVTLTGGGEAGRARMQRIKDFRSILGGTLAPDTAWMLTRSLETCWIRMQRQAEKATKVAAALARHPRVEKVIFPGSLTPADGDQYRTYTKQCSGPGSLMTFHLRDASRQESYAFLNALKIAHLAVSLGGTESLIEHPRSMTHSDMTVEDLDRAGITENAIRLSVGLESSEDLIADLTAALDSTAVGERGPAGLARV